MRSGAAGAGPRSALMDRNNSSLAALVPGAQLHYLVKTQRAHCSRPASGLRRRCRQVRVRQRELAAEMRRLVDRDAPTG
jgi:hypothetical protein